jgi:hypothetical protein
MSAWFRNSATNTEFDCEKYLWLHNRRIKVDSNKKLENVGFLRRSDIVQFIKSA